MKKQRLALALLTLVFMASTTYAADLIVEEGGIAPNYNSIQAAVDDATPGDRIFIKNKGQNIPWIESVTIDRPVSLLPLDSAFWLLTGSLIIDPDSAQFSPTVNAVTILGASINVGNIYTSTHPNPDFIDINIVSNRLISGYIETNDSKMRSNISGNLLENGAISIGYGVVSGNQVNGDINVYDINNGTNDTTYVTGNRIINAANGFPGNIYYATNETYCYIANNYIRFNGSGQGAIRIGNLKMAGSGGNTIVNNSVETSSGYPDGIQLIASIAANTLLRIENNAFFDDMVGEPNSNLETMVDFGSVNIAAVVTVNYNVYKNYDGGMFDYTPSGVYALGNTESASPTFDLHDTTGVCTDTDCVDKGSDNVAYTDHDLSRNDRGVAGGSLNYTNFWPILTGGPRVSMVRIPRKVIEGNTINVEADGFDR